MTIEVVVYSIESALNAQKGGANRIELCASPAEGGTTPSVGVMEIVRQAFTLDIYAMIRPRGGDFVYSAFDYFAMKRDIEMCKRASMDGVVFGILKADGTLDKDRCKKLVEAARPMKVTCHRAFDVTRDPYEALEDCIAIGFNRILTSGRSPSAEAGIEVLKELVKRAAGRISIMPGSGIHENNAAKIVNETGVKEIHFSASSSNPSSDKNYNPSITFTSALPEDYLQQRTTDPDKIKRTRENLRPLST